LRHIFEVDVKIRRTFCSLAQKKRSPVYSRKSLFSGIRMATFFRGQTRFKERVGLVSFRMAREYLNDFLHNLIVST